MVASTVGRPFCKLHECITLLQIDHFKGCGEEKNPKIQDNWNHY